MNFSVARSFTRYFRTNSAGSLNAAWRDGQGLGLFDIFRVAARDFQEIPRVALQRIQLDSLFQGLLAAARSPRASSASPRY